MATRILLSHALLTVRDHQPFPLRLGRLATTRLYTVQVEQRTTFCIFRVSCPHLYDPD